MIGQIIGSLGGLAATYLDSKAVVKKAEAETKMKIATGEISWEQAAIQASDGSWKDEAWGTLIVLERAQVLQLMLRLRKVILRLLLLPMRLH